MTPPCRAVPENRRRVIAIRIVDPVGVQVDLAIHTVPVEVRRVAEGLPAGNK